MAPARLVPAAEALAAAGIEPIELTAKEGLALINGTDGMLGMLVLALSDLEALLRVADVAAAMSVEALLGTDRVFAEDLIALRPQPGQVASASNLRRAAGGVCDRREPSLSAIRGSRTRTRCGARPRWSAPRGTRLRSLPGVASVELRSAIDNPMVLARRPGRVVRQLPRGAGRDGVRLPGDRGGRGGRDRRAADRPAARRRALARAAAVPGRDPGVDSGMMIAGYTQAALVAENRRLAAPASVDSLPTSAMQEDHVSMGWGAARKLRLVGGEPWRGSSPSSWRARRAGSICGRRCRRRRVRPRRCRWCARGFPGRARTATCRPSWRRSRSWCGRGRCWPRSRTRSGRLPERFERRVKRPEALALLAVGLDPLGDRLDQARAA